MRRYNLHVPAVGCAMIVLGVSSGGCFKYHEDCVLTFECPSESDMTRLTPPPPPPPNPECIPGDSGWLPPDSCGVFLSQSLGDDAGEGTIDKPVKTFRQAIQLATNPGEKRVVYACAEEFQESVLIETDVTIYGGFQCGRAWTYLGNEKKTHLTTTPEAMGWDRIPLTITTDTSSDRLVRIHNVHVKALEGADGSSSIAAYLNQASVHLANCKLEASDGADGRPGDSYEPESKAAQGLPGNPGKLSCSDSPVMGGDETEKKCEGGGSTFGGAGGEGHVDIGKNGDEGYPAASGGIGGLGEYEKIENSYVPCKDGEPGADGSVGASGPGGSKSNSLAGFLETLTLGEDGQVGSWGKPGQGGGGGGGSKSGGKGVGKCASALDGGASGGSGGTGGCGGLGGPGGHAGGSSIALVSLGATLTLEGVELVARDGGRGGNGGSGQEGGLGGAGGPGGPNTGFVNTKPGCSGGAGGNGGKGGTGGGGTGGYSVGIAYRGTAPVIAEEGILIGKAGAGGTSDTETSKGGAGEAVKLYLFSE